MPWTSYDRSWVLHMDEIAAWCEKNAGEAMPIGGRVLCDADQDEDELAAFLAYSGLTLSDIDQFEVFASRALPTTITNILGFIELLQNLTEAAGYRLMAVEGGNPEVGEAVVLAGELSYAPMWKSD